MGIKEKIPAEAWSELRRISVAGQRRVDRVIATDGDLNVLREVTSDLFKAAERIGSKYGVAGYELAGAVGEEVHGAV